MARRAPGISPPALAPAAPRGEIFRRALRWQPGRFIEPGRPRLQIQGLPAGVPETVRAKKDLCREGFYGPFAGAVTLVWWKLRPVYSALACHFSKFCSLAFFWRFPVRIGFDLAI